MYNLDIIQFKWVYWTSLRNVINFTIFKEKIISNLFNNELKDF